MDSSSHTSVASRVPEGKRDKVGPERQRVPLRSIGILLAIWIVALVPLLFVRTEWFGRPLSDQQIGEYLHAEQPYLIEHALAQIGERMSRHDPSVDIWYADLIRLAGDQREQVRALDATVMGNDPAQDTFHEALQHLLGDPSKLVRLRAALALAHFGDAYGRQEFVTGVRPWSVTAPSAGRVREIAQLGLSVRQSASIARIDSEHGAREVASPISGRITTVAANVGSLVEAGAELVTVDPGPDVLTDVLGGLAEVGNSEDLALLKKIQQNPAVPERVRQKAATTAQTILARSGPNKEQASGASSQKK